MPSQDNAGMAIPAGKHATGPKMNGDQGKNTKWESADLSIT